MKIHITQSEIFAARTKHQDSINESSNAILKHLNGNYLKGKDFIDDIDLLLILDFTLAAYIATFERAAADADEWPEFISDEIQ